MLQNLLISRLTGKQTMIGCVSFQMRTVICELWAYSNVNNLPHFTLYDAFIQARAGVQS